MVIVIPPGCTIRGTARRSFFGRRINGTTPIYGSGRERYTTTKPATVKSTIAMLRASLSFGSIGMGSYAWGFWQRGQSRAAALIDSAQ
jgi:hypothetical protein